MKLLIISHTEHYKTHSGSIVGWGPTVNEINHLIAVFDEITHVAMLQKGEAPPSSVPYTSSKIRFVALPPLGGKSLGDKVKLLVHAPKVISIVQKELKKTDIFQLRTPTGMGVFLIPYLTLFVKTKGWYKYAGNWNQQNPPLGYRLQRWILKKQHRPVTINGKWDKQPAHCLPFENPCLTTLDFEEGIKIISSKEYQPPFSFCFVGRLEKAKGVERIIQAFTQLSPSEKEKIDHIDFIGDGDDAEEFKKIALVSGITMNFHGFLSREKVFDIYKNTHFFLLPSTASEGFPKVIAEAMNFGCIPVVSDVSSIGQYINKENGYICSPATANELLKIIERILISPEEEIHQKALNGTNVSKHFTFQNYNNRIKKEVLTTESKYTLRY